MLVHFFSVQMLIAKTTTISLLFQIRKRQSSSSMIEDRFAASAREYVESLHQNSRTHLLYGKNNVLVQPVLLLIGCLSVYQAQLFYLIRLYICINCIYCIYVYIYISIPNCSDKLCGDLTFAVFIYLVQSLTMLIPK